MTDTNLTWSIFALVVLAVVLIVAVTVASYRGEHRTAKLRERFGPEYDRTIERMGKRRGERDLESRAERVKRVPIRDLSEPDRVRFSSAWTEIQSLFVDDPGAAVRRANELIKDVMRARGYSAEEGFEQRAADLSVDHPDVVEHYRAARGLAERKTDEGTNTEELRQAVVHYRVLFADLLEPAKEEVAPRPLRPVPA